MIISHFSLLKITLDVISLLPWPICFFLNGRFVSSLDYIRINGWHMTSPILISLTLLQNMEAPNVGYHRHRNHHASYQLFRWVSFFFFSSKKILCNFLVVVRHGHKIDILNNKYNIHSNSISWLRWLVFFYLK